MSALALILVIGTVVAAGIIGWALFKGWLDHQADPKGGDE